jgi:hypothetical protein
MCRLAHGRSQRLLISPQRRTEGRWQSEIVDQARGQLKETPDGSVNPESAVFRDRVPRASRKAYLPCPGALERVAGIKLHSRFRGEDSEHTAAFCVSGKSRLAHFTRSTIQNIVVIVATREFKLLVVCADSCSDRCELTKIKWRTSNRSQLANWDARLVRYDFLCRGVT